MSKYKRLGKNVILVFLGNAGAKLINLVLLPFYTRWLSVEDYGVTDMLNVYVMLLTALVTVSIAEAAFVFPKTSKIEGQKAYFSSGLSISIVFLLLAGGAFYMLREIFLWQSYSSIFTDYTIEIYALLFANFLQSYVQQFCRGIDKMKIYSTTGIVLTTCTAIYSFFFIPRFGVIGYVWAMILSNLTAAFYSFFSSGAFKYFSFQFVEKEKYFQMIKYSLPLMPNAIMWWFIGYLNRPLIENYSGLKSVGFLAVANKFPSVVTMVFAVFFYSWQISVIEEFGREGYKEFYNKVLNVLLISLCFCTIGLSVFSELIIKLMTDIEFHEAWIYVPILAIAPLFQAISSYSSANFTAIKETKYVFYSSLIGAIVSLGMNFILIPVLGIWGAVISIIIAHIAMMLARVAYAWRYVQITNIFGILNMLLLTSSISLSIILINDNIFKYFLVVVFFMLLLILNKNILSNLFITIKKKYENFISRN